MSLQSVVGLFSTEELGSVRGGESLALASFVVKRFVLFGRLRDGGDCCWRV